jgi:2',3'-cyclic-nucleotide 2'-phosphodiesterase (5'-nucleotidase family)
VQHHYTVIPLSFQDCVSLVNIIIYINITGYFATIFKTLMQDISHPGKVEFNDEVASIDREAKRLKAQGIDILIALGHSGFGTDQKIAREVPDIDLVIGGHTNTFLYTGE